MSYESDIANSEINKFQQLFEINLDNLRVLLLGVMGIFERQAKGPLNVSKNMVIILHEIIATDKQSFDNWAEDFEDESFSKHLNGLRSLRDSGEVYSRVMVSIHTLFSGRCAQLARYDLLRVDQRVLTFTGGKQGIPIPENLKQERQKAEEKLNVVGNLCYKYRITQG